MNKLYTFLFLIGFSLNMGAQSDHVDVSYTSTPISIDGMVDDAWSTVDPVYIEKNFQSEQPTITAYWKALWDYDNLYVLIYVEDDDHWPAWESGGSWYEYDQPEVYLDVNYELKDGLGPGGKGNGHYQTLASFYSGGDGVVTALEESNYRTGGTFCYSLSGENYTMEYAMDYESFMDKDGFTLSVEDFVEIDEIGFDVTIIDQDEGVTDSRQRAVWQNEGDQDENYNNMDDAGTISFKSATSISKKTFPALSVYPNPVNDKLFINARFDRISIINIHGQEIICNTTSDQILNTKGLPNGMYLIQVFNHEKLVGSSRIIKQ